MQKNKLIGILLLCWVAVTIAGMSLENSVYWRVYNYATIILSLFSGIVLLRQRS